MDGATLSIARGTYTAILGASGSGKSTLMHLIGLLDRPTSGEYWLCGQPTAGLSPRRRAALSRAHIGFVFQSFSLVPGMNALENAALPLALRGMPRSQRRDLAADMLCMVGLGARLHHTPEMLSGGQQQRVAIARAVAAKPPIIMADEPTGNLDSASGREIMEQLSALNRAGTSIILITHDNHLAEMAQRIVTIQDGHIISDRRGKGGVL